MKNYYMFSIAVITGLLPLTLLASSKLESIPDDFDSIRDPMTPPGYQQPREKEDPVKIQREAIAARITWPTLQLRGITHTGDGKFVAIIDQIGIVEPGDIIRLRQADLIYTWRIDAIDATGLTSTRLHVAQSGQPGAPLHIIERPAPNND